jgi:DNA-binding winged helix-turn-helix (wHTH) protein/TolB-like protein
LFSVMISPPTAYEFGSFRLDAVEKALFQEGRPVPLTPKAIETLLALVERHGRLVTKEELFRLVWPDAFVEENNLAQNISMLRRVLGESTSGLLIETVPTRGYRFLADVRTVEPGPVAVARETNPRPTAAPRVRWLIAFALLPAIGLPAMWGLIRRDGPPAPPRSVAVLPFSPLVAGSQDEALEVGLAEAVIIRLSQLKKLRVPSINAVRHYARLNPDPRSAGRQLDVDAVLQGSLLRLNGNVRLTARLIDVASGTTLWARQWDFPWTDIFTVQDSMSAEVSRALAVSLGTEERGALQRHPTNVAAYEAYLRARYLLLRRTVGDSRRAAELLEEAIRLDPDSAAAYASLGFAFISIPLHEGPTKPFVELGRQAARRALALDPTIAEAHAVLAES